MLFSRIFFENLQSWMELDKIQVIATEWCRIFLRLQGIPCPADIYSSYIQDNDSTEASARKRASVSADEEISD